MEIDDDVRRLLGFALSIYEEEGVQGVHSGYADGMRILLDGGSLGHRDDESVIMEAVAMVLVFRTLRAVAHPIMMVAPDDWDDDDKLKALAARAIERQEEFALLFKLLSAADPRGLGVTYRQACDALSRAAPSSEGS
jgi:hypothetical protein